MNNLRFEYRKDGLYCEEVPVSELSQIFGTPLYIYTRSGITDSYNRLASAFAPLHPLICYAVKANSNLAIIRHLKELGSGFDIVSGGELFRAITVGADPQKICFAGVGKKDEEILQALQYKILMLNVESEAELENINHIAKSLSISGHVSLRVNPDITPETHPYLVTGKKSTKFGIDFKKIKDLLQRWSLYPSLELMGFHIHVGSQITQIKPYEDAAMALKELVSIAFDNGFPVKWINIGGGLGIPYNDKDIIPPLEDFASAIIPLIQSTGCRLIFEPGRFIVGNSGILVTRVMYIKESLGKYFVICDAGMNDLIRPTLYHAYHHIWPVHPSDETSVVSSEVVGPICESGDYFATSRDLPRVRRGDLLAIFSAGAYGFSMSSQYNSRPRAAEVMVSGKEYTLIRERESYQDLIREETLR